MIERYLWLQLIMFFAWMLCESLIIVFNPWREPGAPLRTFLAIQAFSHAIILIRLIFAKLLPEN